MCEVPNISPCYGIQPHYRLSVHNININWAVWAMYDCHSFDMLVYTGKHADMPCSASIACLFSYPPGFQNYRNNVYHSLSWRKPEKICLGS